MADDQSSTSSINQRALTYLQNRMFPEAVNLIEDSCRQNSDDTEAWEILAAACYQLGEIDRVLDACRQLVRLQPESVQAHFNLALALDETGNPGDAITAWRNVLSLEPDNSDALYNLALALQKQGETGVAISHYREALGIRPFWPEAQNNLALALREMGNTKAAIDVLKKAIASSPHLLKLRYTLGETYAEDCRFGDSLQTYREALSLEPENAHTIARVGSALFDQGSIEEALSHYHKAMNLQPDDPEIILGLIDIYDSAGEYDKAFSHLLPFIEKNPDNANFILRFASICNHSGRCNEAVKLLENLLGQGHLLPGIRRKIHFALGKLLDAMGNYDKAFIHFKQANSLKHYSYDIKRFSGIATALTTAYSKTIFDKMPRASTMSNQPQPVFIVGMPRSGTTLVEQIIATHSQIHGAGELDIVPRLVANMANELGSKEPYPNCIEHLSQEALTAFSKDYLDRVGDLYSGKEKIVTDKMPENFLHLGLIELLFPNARIIHCTREPLDTCLSCFFQEFSGTHHYAYDLTNLGAYYYQYRKLMTHWEQILTLPVLEVRYETMVNDTVSMCRAIFDFLNLDWEEQCLLFYKSGRFVNTASQKQVTQPIYTASAGRWKHYKKHLGPLREALEKGT